MDVTEESLALGDAALIGALLLFCGLGLLPLGRLIAERSFPNPRVLFVRWGFTHVVVVVLVFVLTSALAMMLIGGGSVPSDLGAQAPSMVDQSAGPASAPSILSTLQALAVGLVGFGFACAFIVWTAHRTEPAPWESLGLRATPHVRAVGLGLVMYVLFIPALFGAGLLAPWLVERLGGVAEGQEVLLAIGALEGGELALAFIVAALLQPFLEELLFRGFLQPLLVQNFRESGGVILTSLLFAVIHGPIAFLPVLCLSLLLGAVYLRTRSLIAVTAIHCFHNGFGLSLFLLNSEWRELSGASLLLGS